MEIFEIGTTPDVFEIGTGSDTFEIGIASQVTEIKVIPEVFNAIAPFPIPIPFYASNKLAWEAGLRHGELYRDTEGNIKVVINPSNLILNLAKAWSYFMRGFR